MNLNPKRTEERPNFCRSLWESNLSVTLCHSALRQHLSESKRAEILQKLPMAEVQKLYDKEALKNTRRTNKESWFDSVHLEQMLRHGKPQTELATKMLHPEVNSTICPEPEESWRPPVRRSMNEPVSASQKKDGFRNLSSRKYHVTSIGAAPNQFVEKWISESAAVQIVEDPKKEKKRTPRRRAARHKSADEKKSSQPTFGKPQVVGEFTPVVENEPAPSIKSSGQRTVRSNALEKLREELRVPGPTPEVENESAPSIKSAASQTASEEPNFLHQAMLLGSQTSSKEPDFLHQAMLLGAQVTSKDKVRSIKNTPAHLLVNDNQALHGNLTNAHGTVTVKGPPFALYL